MGKNKCLQLAWLFLLTLGCSNSRHEHGEPGTTNVANVHLDSIQFPVVIEDGKKIVYQFTKMTPRGPRSFLDTADYNPEEVVYNLWKATFLFPLSLSAEDRNTSPAIIAISMPGLWEETIFGLINEKDQLKINFRNSLLMLPAREKIVFTPGKFKRTFADGSIHVELTADLTETITRTHLSGKGKMQVSENNDVLQEADVLIVVNIPERP